MIKIALSDSPFFDEMLMAEGKHRSHYQAYWQWLQQADQQAVQRKKEEAALLFHRVGITCNAYGEDDGAGRPTPVHSVARIIPARESPMLDRGHRHRVHAAEDVAHDIYHDQKILKAGIVPAEQVLANDQYQPCMQGIDLHRDTSAHIAGRSEERRVGTGCRPWWSAYQ